VRLKYSLTRGIQNLLRQEPCKGAETDFRAKSGKETVAGAHRRPKWIPHYGGQADSGRGQDSSGSTQLCSGSTPACSPLAQVKAAVARVRRLKRNQRKGKLILSLGASNPETLRMWLKSIKVNEFENSHPNMSIGGTREQILEVVHVERQLTQKKRRRPLRLLFASLLGWILLAGLFGHTIIMQCYWALTFLVLMPLTGASITRIHVKGPRYLNIEGSSPFNRLVVVTQHMNETNWRVFYGESSVVNALLNKPLLRNRPRPKIKRAKPLSPRMLNRSTFRKNLLDQRRVFWPSVVELRLVSSYMQCG